MQPTWATSDGSVQLYLADCLDVLPTLEAGSVDAVVTDPPWKAGSGGRVHRREGDGRGVAPSKLSTSLAYGDIGFFSPEAIKEFGRISRGDILVLCGYLELPEVIANIRRYRGILVWHNTRPTPIPGPVAARDVAYIVWGGERTLIEPSVRRWPSCIFKHAAPQAGCMATERLLKADGTTAHPAQEPLGLFVDLVSPLGNVVLDPYLGSGTTAVACIRSGRRFVGIEKQPEYFDLARGRIEAELNRQPLFEPAPEIVQRELL